jgi:hypothetical protein
VISFRALSGITDSGDISYGSVEALLWVSSEDSAENNERGEFSARVLSYQPANRKNS